MSKKAWDAFGTGWVNETPTPAPTPRKTRVVTDDEDASRNGDAFGPGRRMFKWKCPGCQTWVREEMSRNCAKCTKERKTR